MEDIAGLDSVAFGDFLGEDRFDIIIYRQLKVGAGLIRKHDWLK